MIKALIFDFDGLILDTETPEMEAWQEIYSEYGIESPILLWGQIVGGTGAGNFDAVGHLADKVGYPLDVRALNTRWRNLSNEIIKNQAVLPGVQTYLDEAKHLGFKLAIASSSEPTWVNEHLSRLRIHHYFDLITCSDEVQYTKPHPELFILTITKLKIHANEAIVFEDSPNGVKAAKAAGVFTVAIPNRLTAQLKINDADIVLNSLEELPLKYLLDRMN